MPAGLDIERLYDEHAQPIYALLLNFTRDEADTRDLRQRLREAMIGSLSDTLRERPKLRAASVLCPQLIRGGLRDRSLQSPCRSGLRFSSSSR